MNIFAIDLDPEVAAIWHVDKHIRKMIIEYAQILSTAHRVLDGQMVLVPSVKTPGRMVKRWILPDSRHEILHQATHPGSRLMKWAMQSTGNYRWLYALFVATCREYTFRFGKYHETMRLLQPLAQLPQQISSAPYSLSPLAMDEEFKIGSLVESYRQFYIIGKAGIHQWTKRDVPPWFPKDSVCLSTSKLSTQRAKAMRPSTSSTPRPSRPAKEVVFLQPAAPGDIIKYVILDPDVIGAPR